MKNVRLAARAPVVVPNTLRHWMARASMLEVMGMDFVKTARAKGVPSG